MNKDQKSRFRTLYVSIAERTSEEGLGAFWERAQASVPEIEFGPADELQGDAAARFLAFVEAEAIAGV